MSRGLNFKQPILNWIAKGNNSRRNEESVVEACRAEVPELKKLAKDRDKTIIDYFRRFQNGMRAAEPKKIVKKAEPKKSAAKKSAKKKAEPIKKVVAKKSASKKPTTTKKLTAPVVANIPEEKN